MLLVACGGSTRTDGPGAGGTAGEDLAGAPSASGSPLFDLGSVHPSGFAGEAGTAAVSGGGSPPFGDVVVDESCFRWGTLIGGNGQLLMLVLDAAESMGLPHGEAQVSNWAAVQAAVGPALEELPAPIAVGVLYFPNMPTTASSTARESSACVNIDKLIPIASLGEAGSDHRLLIAQSLSDTYPGSPAGRPTHDAYHIAREEAAETLLSGHKSLLLVTDGLPTFLQGCLGGDEPVDAGSLVEEISQAALDGIDTFVIGLPGSEGELPSEDARPWLSRAAQAGRTAPIGCTDSGPNWCHVDLASQADVSGALRGALAEVVDSILCHFLIPPPRQPGEEFDPSRFNVVLHADGAPELIAQGSAGHCTEGWHYSPDGLEVVLCEETCNRIMAKAQWGLKVEYGCPTEVAVDQ